MTVHRDALGLFIEMDYDCVHRWTMTVHRDGLGLFIDGLGLFRDGLGLFIEMH